MKRVVTLTSGGLLLAMVFGLFGCGHKEAAKTADKSKGKGEKSDLVRVRVGQASEQVADETLAVTGSIFASTDVNIASKVSGRVVRIGADDGQRVPSGRVLVQLDSRQARAEVQRAAGALASARASLAKAQLNQGLVEVSSSTSFRQAENDLAVARARLKSAQEAAKLAGTKSGEKGVDVAQADTTVESSRSRLAQAKESLRITKDKVENDLTSALASVNQSQTTQQTAASTLAQAETSLQLADSTTAAAVENARQAVVAAQNALAVRETGARSQERLQAKSLVDSARSGMQTAQLDYDRAKRLFEAGAIAKAQLDNTKLMLDTRTEQYNQATQNMSLVQEGPRQEEIRIAQAQLAQAKEQQRAAVEQRTRELANRQQDVSKARQDQSRIRDSLIQAEAAQKTSLAARGQIAIQEQAVSQAEQSLAQAEQAARLAHAGVGSYEIARQEVAAAQTAVQSADQRLRLARSNLTQPKLSQEDIRNLIGTVRQASAAYQTARVVLSDHTVIAPLAGAVAEKKVEVGEVVQPGQSLYRLVSDGWVKFNALVPEEKVRFVSPGSEVDVRVDALPDRKFTGRVLEVFPAADQRSRTFTVKIGVPNADAKLREGMFARGSIVVQRNKHMLRVPAEAVISRDDKTWVVRLEGADRALPTQVTVGSTRNGTVEITDGKLLPGDKILVQGAADITSEQRVQIVEDKPDQGAAPADGKAGPDTKSSSPDAKGSAPGGPKKS